MIVVHEYNQLENVLVNLGISYEVRVSDNAWTIFLVGTSLHFDENLKFIRQQAFHLDEDRVK